MIQFIQCEICFETVASCEFETLRQPLTGNQFGSPDELHGVPPPFHPSLSWEDLRCPHCQFRPFTEPDSIVLHTVYGPKRINVQPKIIAAPAPPAGGEVNSSTSSPATSLKEGIAGEDLEFGEAVVEVDDKLFRGKEAKPDIPHRKIPSVNRKLYACKTGCKRRYRTSVDAKACTHGAKK